MPTKTPGLTEAHVQQTISQFMELDGWRYIRTHPLPPIVQRLDAIMRKAPRPLNLAWQSIRGYVLTHTHNETFGEKGMPDGMFVRYLRYAAPGNYSSTDTETLWIEFKLPGKKPDSDQLQWHAEERARGGMVYVADDIDDYIRNWYPKSGLQRRPPVVR